MAFPTSIFYISQYNQQYNVNASQQDNTGCIPKAVWEQFPPHVNSAIVNSQHHNKQEVNSTTAHSNDQTDHSVTYTIPTYTSNSAHQVQTPTLTVKFRTLLCLLHAVSLVALVLLMYIVAIIESILKAV